MSGPDAVWRIRQLPAGVTSPPVPTDTAVRGHRPPGGGQVGGFGDPPSRGSRNNGRGSARLPSGDGTGRTSPRGGTDQLPAAADPAAPPRRPRPAPARRDRRAAAVHPAADRVRPHRRAPARRRHPAPPPGSPSPADAAANRTRPSPTCATAPGSPDTAPPPPTQTQPRLTSHHIRPPPRPCTTGRSHAAPHRRPRTSTAKILGLGGLVITPWLGPETPVAARGRRRAAGVPRRDDGLDS